MKTQNMCIDTARIEPCTLEYVPDWYKTYQMCIKAVKEFPWLLEFVPDHLKTENWFLTQQQVKIWHNGNDFYDKDETIQWYEGYQKRKAQKAQIEKELMRTAWHPSSWWGWCMPEDEKKETEKLCTRISAFLCLLTGCNFFFDSNKDVFLVECF